MNLEDEILAVEESAAKAVAAAQAEAKRLLGTAGDAGKRIREEAALRAEAEKGRLAREHAESLKGSLAEIAREQSRAEAALAKVRGERVEGCAREVVALLVKG